MGLLRVYYSGQQARRLVILAVVWPMVGTTQRSRGWVFTINNYNEWDFVNISKLEEKAQYYIYGKERGEEGTPHLQGFAYFKQRISFNGIRDILTRAHVEIQRGFNAQAIDYCKKEGEFTEWGEPSRGPAGQKDKWKDVLQLARQGKVQEIEERYPAIFLRYFQKLCGFYRPEHSIILENFTNEWWWGPTGTGKFKKLNDDYPDPYEKSLDPWWDNYQREEIVAIEEFEPRCKINSFLLKRWADRYPFRCEVKGAFLSKLRPLKIIVISNYQLDECFPNSKDLDPLKRRFKEIHFP
ncbi:replication-associated protein [Dragonfly larvae associated circular virus-4]|uniref:Replication-associated protein n=1 Tax=Dragonfly larvae associated circular virus-4 TaxID=1454025 RepID=W5U1V6_9VIRU|nr:replication-associated protein [Dragonfly larvae associated circular virus-4]AHH31468.1 replication-associated protein [Dragonfly larvae associated circular virus-4]